jgi:hypothetical protein
MHIKGFIIAIVIHYKTGVLVNFLVTVTAIHERIISGRKDVFWLRVSEILAHSPYCHSFWAYGEAEEVWRRRLFTSW